MYARPMINDIPSTHSLSNKILADATTVVHFVTALRTNEDECYGESTKGDVLGEAATSRQGRHL